MAEANGELGSINLDDTKDIDQDLEGIEDPAVLKEQVLKARTFARQAVARAKKAESKKAPEEKKTPEEPKDQGASHTSKAVLTAEDVDIRVLRAQKMPEEEIKYLKKVAALNETGIIEAQSDEVYLAWKQKKEDDDKAEKARLGASQGSGSKKKEKEINTPGLSDADHKEKWKEHNAKQ